MIQSQLITCEHAVRDVPAGYRHLFDGNRAVVESHRGWDAGAWEVAQRLAMLLGAPLLVSSVTRLLVDLNRRESNPEIFSEFTRDLAEEERQGLLERYHRRYRRNAWDMVEVARLRDHRVLHLSVHSFTPHFEGEKRDGDIGVLFDPGRKRESEFSQRYLKEMQRLSPGLRIRANYPYLGVSDGLTAWLREKFGEDQYLGIELELNQGPYFQEKARWKEISDTVAEGLQAVLGE